MNTASIPTQAAASHWLENDLRKVWRFTSGDPRVRVAVIDGEVDRRHPCFRGTNLIVRPLAQTTGCRPESASCAHGTYVSSILFCNRNAGCLSGVAPGCTGIIIPVFSDHPRVRGQVQPCSQAELGRAIRIALREGADVINISAGQMLAGAVSPELTSAVKDCELQSVIVVAAAGNDGCDCEHAPAVLPGVLVAASADAAGKPSEFSNYARSYRSHGVAAPGEETVGAKAGSAGCHRRSGTSSSAPYVSGVAALLLSAWLVKSGEKSINREVRRRVREVILASVVPCELDKPNQCRRLLSGKIQPAKALELLFRGGPTMNEENVRTTTLRNGRQPNGYAEPGAYPSCAGKPGCNCGCGSQEDGQDNEGDRESEMPEPGIPEAEPQTVGGRHRGDHSLSQAGRYDGIRNDGSNPAVVDVMEQRRRRASGVPPPSAMYGASHLPEQRAGISPLSCEGGCAGGGALVYALGEISYDFGTQARMDAIAAEMGDGQFPGNPGHLLAFLRNENNAHFAASIIWTVNHDATPIYALRPEGAYARETFTRILLFFAEQVTDVAHRASFPGVLDGSVVLQSGQTVPVLIPELRGMYNWNTDALVKAIMARKEKKENLDRAHEGLRNFLERVYYEVRNLGQSPQERALNFAATNAFNVQRVFLRAAEQLFQLDEIGVERSPVCRQDSDCWDVRLIFFDPANALIAARQVYRFTVDVSDLVPVLVGPVRNWAIR
ncbi:MAG: PatA/PatG family cyanobactin maturation protease [Bryobacterales bacterium]|nr:PatA/PatG family cyanobactin maturation protease [Bryobacterales bacterium]